MKCLVSGATGFIGRLLCQRLSARGDTVIALSKSGDPLANGQPTITTIDPAMQNVIGRGTGLSDCDISGIRNLYLNARGCDNGGGNLFILGIQRFARKLNFA